MARSGNLDPFDKYRWTVDIEAFSRSGFAACSTPEYAISTKSYPEGGAHLTPRLIVDSVSYKPVTLLRGVTNDTSFNKWATGFMDTVQNNAGVKGSSSDPFASIGNLVGAVQDNFASPVPTYQAEKIASGTFNYRRRVKIEHVDRRGLTQVIYYLYNAFPIEYKPASDFDSGADGEVSVETLVLGYESFEVKYTGIVGAAASLIASAL